MNIIKFIIKLFIQNTSNGYDSSNPGSSSSPCAALYPMSEHGSTPNTYRKMNRKETELFVAFCHVYAFVLQVWFINDTNIFACLYLFFFFEI